MKLKDQDWSWIMWHGFVAAALALLFFVSGCSSSSPKLTDDPLKAHILNRRAHHIERMAPQIGIPVDVAMRTRVTDIHLCPEQERNGDGSYSCDKGCIQIDGCAHAWCRPTVDQGTVEYLYVQPVVADPIIAHEKMHELLDHYGIGGHPKWVTVTRLDNGEQLKFSPAKVIGGRWPYAPVNVLLPQSMEIGLEWGNDFDCGVPDETFIDGAGI